MQWLNGLHVAIFTAQIVQILFLYYIFERLNGILQSVNRHLDEQVKQNRYVIQNRLYR